MYECAKFDDDFLSGERMEILAVADSYVVSGQGLVLALEGPGFVGVRGSSCNV